MSPTPRRDKAASHIRKLAQSLWITNNRRTSPPRENIFDWTHAGKHVHEELESNLDKLFAWHKFFKPPSQKEWKSSHLVEHEAIMALFTVYVLPFVLPTQYFLLSVYLWLWLIVPGRLVRVQVASSMDPFLPPSASVAFVSRLQLLVILRSPNSDLIAVMWLLQELLSALCCSYVFPHPQVTFASVFMYDRNL